MCIPDIVMKICFADINDKYYGSRRDLEGIELRDTIQRYITGKYKLSGCEFVWQHYPMSVIFSDTIISFSLVFKSCRVFNVYKIKNYESYNELLYYAI